MEFILTIVIVTLIFGFLVFIHEAGHFFFAKINGVTVLEFAFGFGKKLWSKTIKGTEYKINLIPLGGYVRMLGDNDGSSFTQDKSFANDPRSYISKTIGQKMAIILGGPVINFIGAIIIFYIVLAIINFKPDPIGKLVNYQFLGASQESGVLYNYVEEGSAAEKAGIPPLGFITYINDQKVNSYTDIVDEVSNDSDKLIEVSVYDYSTLSFKDFQLDLNTNKFGMYLLDKEFEDYLQLEETPYYYYVGLTEEGVAKKSNLPVIGFILSIEDDQIQKNQDLSLILNKYENQEATVKIKTIDNEIKDYTVQLGAKDSEGKVRLGVFQGQLRSAIQEYYIIDYSSNKIFAGIFHSINVTVYQMLGLGQLIGDAFSGNAAMLLDSVGTPIKVGEVIYTEVARSGSVITPEFITNLLNITGLLSATLAFMNMLPIPLVDGGQFYLLIFEKLRGRPLSEKKQELLGKLGLLFLVVLSVVFILKDLWQVIFSRLFR